MEFLFSEKSGVYTPTAYAAGPFKNLHGGAGAAIMASHVLKTAPEGFTPVSQRTEFLRSTPLTGFSLSANLVRDGRRHIVYDVELTGVESQSVTARSTLTLYNPKETALIEPLTPKPWGGFTNPNTLQTIPDMPSPSGSMEWMIAATDVRVDMKGLYWFRWRGALLENMASHWFTQTLGPADWVAGFVAPGFPMPTKVGVWPNTELTVHVDRPFEGEWLGLRPRGRYLRTGYGLGHTGLYDENGLFGHALASTISPL